ncbi:polysaccharide biosynthesis tyrosine autokinase [Bradyrhizobium sp. BR13661]|jgi:succinoglycan biosynthesis transport protein ExoP|uniref:polysaccharide biosynthesis tyrosine autokinase n=1 Tax=Bradyrhizobium sp. BR13661 TaxID=2940622 RepID=UPI0024762F78|nr:polysaccharide biosynthesis tyrosine autokinase [Bradyrhizobium sp. BR13661]MDH6264381.1 succinoglycan biosynthesis transport protein ExoP [Bradyrhizobium sp. BR13661]
MLQVPHLKPTSEYRSSPIEMVSTAKLLDAILSLTRRRLGILVLIFSVSVICGVIYLYTSPPKFLAQAELLIDTKKTQLFQQQSITSDYSMDSAAVDSQIQVLMSENIAAAVIKDLHLTADPEFVTSKPGILGRLLGLFSPAAPVSELALQQRAYGYFRGGLVARRIGLTYVIQVGFLSLSPGRAAQIANATADAYINDQLEAKYQATRRASTWLQERIQELRQQASTAERAVLDFKKQNNIVDTGGRLMSEQQLAELNSQLVLARANAAEANARLNRISEITKNDVSNIDNVLRSPDPAVADVLHSEVINKLRSEYLDTANKQSTFETRLGRDHLVVIGLRNQMYQIRKSIFDELKRIQETYKSDLQIAVAREQSIEKSLADSISQNQMTNQAQISLKDLDAKAQTFRAMHDNFVQRYMESLQQQSFPYTEARVITHAEVPGSNSTPNSKLVIAVASVGGLVLAFGIALLIDASERGFRTPDQVETELRASCLAIVPAIKSEAAPGAVQNGKLERDSSRQINRTGLLSSVVSNPFSRFAEAFRAIKVSIDLFSLGKAVSAKAIGITSTNPAEGKSTVAANLARLISHAGGKAILLDCDLRNPSLSRSLAPGAEIGLLEVLSGKRLLKDVVWTDPMTSLAFVPMVAQTRLSHTNEILASAGMKKLIEALREIYDYILIDLPPLNPVVDVRSTNQIVDSYLFVIEWGQTSFDAVEHALSSAPLVYENLLGVILNKADLEAMRNYSRNAGDIYSNEYHERYGFND